MRSGVRRFHTTDALNAMKCFIKYVLKRGTVAVFIIWLPFHKPRRYRLVSCTMIDVPAAASNRGEMPSGSLLATSPYDTRASYVHGAGFRYCGFMVSASVIPTMAKKQFSESAYSLSSTPGFVVTFYFSLFIYLFICLFIYLFICLLVCLFVCLFIYLFYFILFYLAFKPFFQ